MNERKLLNVCFTDSECGLVKVATGHFKNTIMSFRGLAYNNISKDFINGRKKWIDGFFDICDKKEKNRILNNYINNFNYILDCAKNGHSIRIWCANNPNSLCGMYHLIHNIKDYNCEITVIMHPVRSDVAYDAWGYENPITLAKSLEFERVLSIQEKEIFSNNWKRLVAENTNLRIVINNEVVSVEEDYFDTLIYNFSSDNTEFTVADIYSKFINNSGHDLEADFIYDRICVLVRQGKFKIVCPNENKFEIVLKR